MASFTVSTNINLVTDALERYGEDAVGAVYAGVLRTGYEALNEARTLAPKGSTSELVRSIVLEEDSDALTVDIFTNKVYAAFVEFGFDDYQTVRSHKRTIAKAFGKRITPKTIIVREHQRFVVAPPRPFMTPAADLAEEKLADNVTAELEALRL